MNVVDYWLGGIQVASIWNALFWLGLAAAAPAGFFAAWPVNHLLLKHELKAGHRRPSDVFPFGSVLRFRVLATNCREERSRCHQNHTI